MVQLLIFLAGRDESSDVGTTYRRLQQLSWAVRLFMWKLHQLQQFREIFALIYRFPFIFVRINLL